MGNENHGKAKLTYVGSANHQKSNRADSGVGNGENDMNMAKSGAGSRGGKVIGTSRSGKPIYASKTAGAHAYASFDASEHTQAAKAHHAEAQNPTLTPDQALAHRSAAVSHQRAANALRAEGSARRDKIQVSRQKMLAHKSETGTTERPMTSTDLFKSFLAKGKFVSGNIEDAETVDGIDADMTGDSSKGKSTSSPGGFTDQEDEVKKVKKKVDKNAKSGGPTKSVAEQTGYEASQTGRETVLNNAGPYDIGGDVDCDIGEAAPTRTIDSDILRSEEQGDLAKAGPGSRGGTVIGTTRSGKAIYRDIGGRHKTYEHFTSGDHMDAMKQHAAESASHHNQTFTDNHEAHQYHKAMSEKHDRRAQAHASLASSKTHSELTDAAAKSEEQGKLVKGAQYLAPDQKSYEQVVEHRGYVTHTTGGLDKYLAHISRGQTFWTNGAESHPGDANSVGQTMCKSCNHQHLEMYTVCPNCHVGPSMNKGYRQSQDHRGGFGMPGREQGSKLVDMSKFSLED